MKFRKLVCFNFWTWSLQMGKHWSLSLSESRRTWTNLRNVNVYGQQKLILTFSDFTLKQLNLWELMFLMEKYKFIIKIDKIYKNAASKYSELSKKIRQFIWCFFCLIKVFVKESCEWRLRKVFCENTLAEICPHFKMRKTRIKTILHLAEFVLRIFSQKYCGL